MSRWRAVLGALLVLGLVGCANVNPDPVTPPTSAHADAVRLVAVGDSITDADSPNFSDGELGAESWVSYVVGDDVTLVGGWAAWGATTGDMARNVEAVDADVLVVMAGTNDVAFGGPFGESAAHIAEIVTTVGASEVIIAGIPPIDHAPDAVTDFNQFLRQFAEEHGWHWIDAGASVRTNNGRFAPGMSGDGVHPTAAGAQRLGESIYPQRFTGVVSLGSELLVARRGEVFRFRARRGPGCRCGWASVPAEEGLSGGCRNGD